MLGVKRDMLSSMFVETKVRVRKILGSLLHFDVTFLCIRILNEEVVLSCEEIFNRFCRLTKIEWALE